MDPLRVLAQSDWARDRRKAEYGKSKEAHTERDRERGLVSRNPSHTGARVLRTASAVSKLCSGRISGHFANPRIKKG